MPSKFNYFIVLLLLSWGIVPVHSQNAPRWLRIPSQSAPTITRHRLQLGDKPGIVSRLDYDKTPATPILHMIGKYFPELSPKKPIVEDRIDVSKSTLLLESLENEANEILYNATDTIVPDTASPTPSLF